MKMATWRTCFLGGALAAFAATGGFAQQGALVPSAKTGSSARQTNNRVAAKTDWSVFVASSPTECWVVSAPKKSLNTRGGRKVSVRRGNILLFVSDRPGSGVKDEVSFTGGYPFAKKSVVTLKIRDASFDLFVDGEWAWSASAADDKKIVAKLKKGTTAVLTGHSKRGTKTVDTFSLLGFTAARAEAQKRCSG